jgi:hypothetical protein
MSINPIVIRRRGGRLVRYGFQPQGTTGAPPSPPTGTTGFRHPRYVIRGRPSDRIIRIGFTPIGATGGGGSGPATGTTGFRRDARRYVLARNVNHRVVRIGFAIDGTGGAAPAPADLPHQRYFLVDVGRLMSR